MISIRHRLLVTLIASFAVVWVAITSLFFVMARHHVTSVLDARLTQSAVLIESLIDEHSPSLSHQGGDSAQTRAASPAYRILAPAGLPSGGTRHLGGTLSAEVWSGRGELVALSANAPLMPFSAHADGLSYARVNGKPWRIYALTDYRNGMHVVVGEPLSIRNGAERSMLIALGLPLFLFIPISAIIIWVGIGQGLSPLNAIRRRLGELRPDDCERLDTAHVPEEVLPLAQAINDMLDRVSETIERERRFTSNASHELRTPMAGLKTQLQVALAARNRERLERSLRGVSQAADRIIHTLDQLLHLARADQPSGELSPLRTVRQALRAAAREEAQTLAARGLTLAERLEFEAPVAVHPLSLEIATRNLLRNAARYSPEGGEIELVSQRAGRRMAISVLDRGPGIDDDEDAQTLTRRFYRGRNPVGHGSGLGLSIVGAIARQAGGSIELANRPGGGLCATLLLPLVASDGGKKRERRGRSS